MDRIQLVGVSGMDWFVECIVSDSHTANFLDLPPLIGPCQIFTYYSNFLFTLDPPIIQIDDTYYSNHSTYTAAK